MLIIFPETEVIKQDFSDYAGYVVSFWIMLGNVRADAGMTITNRVGLGKPWWKD